MFYTNPLYGFIRALFLFVCGKVKFNKSVVGDKIILDDGSEFIIFRRVKIKYFNGNMPIPQGMFIVRFQPKMSIQKNIQLSRIMLMIFIGFKGFRSKYWCVNDETGECLGIYKWDKLEDVKRYSKSIAINNMTKRSVPGSVSYQVLENIDTNKHWQYHEMNDNEKLKFKNKYYLN